MGFQGEVEARVISKHVAFKATLVDERSPGAIAKEGKKVEY